MLDPISASARRTTQRHLQSATDALNLMDSTEQRQPSFVRIVDCLKSGRPVDGYDGERLEEFARLRGIDFDPFAPRMPWTDLAVRATPLTVGSSAGGGFLVDGGLTAPGLIDIFRPFSPLIASGVTVYDGLTQNAIFPRVTGDVTGGWLIAETNSASESPPLLGQIAATPKTWAATCRWSRQLELQAPNLENFLRQIFARAAIMAIDTAALNGPDQLGQPLGLLNTAGIGTQSGTSYSHANSWTTRTSLATANVNDTAVSWLGTPAVRGILAARERGAGDEYIWNASDQVTGRNAQVSTIVPAGTLIAGDFSSLTYAFFGDGFQLDSTPFNSAADFAAGISAMRIMVSVDTFLQHPSAFVAITGVT
jgi:HK97 family phage major capsid protein